MKTCPFCREQVHDDASKCRYCQSSLLPAPGPAPAPASGDGRTVTYVVDTGLVTFAKFTGGALAVLLVVGSYLFGFKLESSLERVAKAQKDVDETSRELTRARADLVAASQAANTVQKEAKQALEQAQQLLKAIGEQKDKADLYVKLIGESRDLSAAQVVALRDVKAAEPGKVRGDYKYWATGATIRIRFLGGTAAMHEKVKAYAQEWLKYANLKFQYVQKGASDVRISFRENNGSWSFVGTDALGVSQEDPTMNLAWIERENVLHEFGHVLGLIEEHQNPQANIPWNVAAVTRELTGPPNFWSQRQVDEKVLRKIPQAQIGPYRPFDPKSIMTFTFEPELTGGQRIGGSGLSESDKALVRRLYADT